MGRIFFPLICLIGWIVGLSLWANTTCCGGIAGAISGLNILDGGKTVAAAKASNLLFGTSNAMYAPMGGEVKGAFGDLAGYLKGNPDKTVNLTGLYTAAEKNDSKFANLGLGRAESIKTYLLGLGVPLTQMAVGHKLLGAHGEVTDDKMVVGGVQYAFSTMPKLNRSISIKDGAKFSANYKDNLAFENSKFEYRTPIIKELDDVFGKTANYLKKNPNRSLLLTGYYTDKEVNSGALANLGLARANNVKQLFRSKGVDIKQISTDAKMRNGIAFDKDKYTYNGVGYTFFDSPKKDAPKVNIAKPGPMTLYFQTNSSNLILSSAQREYFANLIKYLDNNKAATITASGHTDNVGDASTNLRLSRNRAEFIQGYLSKNGISIKQIIPNGFGPDKPIKTNDTPEGRSKNRRVEINVN